MYLHKYYEDYWFIEIIGLGSREVPSIGQTVEMSKLPKLRNIQIAQPSKEQSGKAISNMSSLNHLTLGYDEDNNKEIVHEELLKEMGRLSELNSLCLVGLQFKDK